MGVLGFVFSCMRYVYVSVCVTLLCLPYIYASTGTDVYNVVTTRVYSCTYMYMYVDVHTCVHAHSGLHEADRRQRHRQTRRSQRLREGRVRQHSPDLRVASRVSC